eukprot:scaffold295555_cov28-Tisochrysis_lutea.AAC.7
MGHIHALAATISFPVSLACTFSCALLPALPCATPSVEERCRPIQGHEHIVIRAGSWQQGRAPGETRGTPAGPQGFLDCQATPQATL